MKNILVIGAGRSASSLIKYLLDNSIKENWKITVGDLSIDLVKQKWVDDKPLVNMKKGPIDGVV